MGYDYTTLLKTLSWMKNPTREVIDVNIPRKSMKAIVLLFTKADAGGSENFPFAGLTKVNVTVEGNPNELIVAFGIRVVPQKILHRQVRLRCGLPNG